MRNLSRLCNLFSDRSKNLIHAIDLLLVSPGQTKHEKKKTNYSVFIFITKKKYDTGLPKINVYIFNRPSTRIASQIQASTPKRWGESNRRIKAEFVKNTAPVHFRQFSPINNFSLSLSYFHNFKYPCPCLLPLFEKPRRDSILPLCRESRGLFIYKREIAIFSAAVEGKYWIF